MKPSSLERLCSRPPIPSDERYHWARVWLAKLDEAEMRELVFEAWRMVVPKRVAAAFTLLPE